jgi:formylglycine-generating enzyme required for sulfatase activity
MAKKMIHLEGNTYIDTSFITYAEYQLFLDQQRSRGHFLQPDHWETVSFPQGLGLAPVLGVRSSDALTFCTWLTERGPGIWQYRLPTLDEHNRLEASKSLVVPTPEGLGYWVENGKAFA